MAQPNSDVTIEFPETGEAYSIDAVENLSIGFSADVTDIDVEDGVDLTDHRVVHPFVISLNGFISDIPYGQVGKYDYEASGKHTAFFGRMIEAFGASEPINIECGSARGFYEDLQIISFNPTWSTDGNSLNFSLELKEIRTAKALTSEDLHKHGPEDHNIGFSAPQDMGQLNPVAVDAKVGAQAGAMAAPPAGATSPDWFRGP